MLILQQQRLIQQQQQSSMSSTKNLLTKPPMSTLQNRAMLGRPGHMMTASLGASSSPVPSRDKRKYDSSLK